MSSLSAELKALADLKVSDALTPEQFERAKEAVISAATAAASPPTSETRHGMCEPSQSASVQGDLIAPDAPGELDGEHLTETPHPRTPHSASLPRMIPTGIRIK